MKSRILIPVSILAVALLIAVFALDDGGSDEGGGNLPVPEPDDPYQEWMHVDASAGTVSFDGPVSWHVKDLLSPCYIKQGVQWVEYEGYGGEGDCIHLDPGFYRITVDGMSADISIPGKVDRSAGWSFIFEGVSHSIDIAYSIDVDYLAGQRSKGMDYNSGSRMHRFEDLPGMAAVTDDVAALESLLESEFVRIGGDPENRQAYADFLASFVQCGISYPQSVYDGDERRGEDMSLYGSDEYWASPLETLNLVSGDCEDTSVLLCALYLAAGYDAAVGGKNGHVFAGVEIDGFQEVSKAELEALDPYRVYKLTFSAPVEGFGDPDALFYAVETIYSQLPVGYIGTVTFGSNTPWGITGFYQCHGAESGIQDP